MPIVWWVSLSSPRASERESVDTIVTYKQHLGLINAPHGTEPHAKSLKKRSYIVRSSGNNDNSVIFEGARWYIGPTAMPRAAVTPIAPERSVYCSRDEVYLPKLSCLIATDGGTLKSKWATYDGCYVSHSWRHKATYDVTAAFWIMVRGCLGDLQTRIWRSSKTTNLRINSIVISIEIQLIKTANRMTKTITLSVCK